MDRGSMYTYGSHWVSEVDLSKAIKKERKKEKEQKQKEIII